MAASRTRRGFVADAVISTAIAFFASGFRFCDASAETGTRFCATTRIVAHKGSICRLSVPLINCDYRKGFLTSGSKKSHGSRKSSQYRHDLNRLRSSNGNNC